MKVFLASSRNVVGILEVICKDEVFPINASKNRSRNYFPVVTSATLGVQYKVMTVTIVVEVKKLAYEVTKDPGAQFFTWSKTVESLVVMTTSLKIRCYRSLLAFF